MDSPASESPRHFSTSSISVLTAPLPSSGPQLRPRSLFLVSLKYRPAASAGTSTPSTPVLPTSPTLMAPHTTPGVICSTLDPRPLQEPESPQRQVLSHMCTRPCVLALTTPLLQMRKVRSLRLVDWRGSQSWLRVQWSLYPDPRLPSRGLLTMSLWTSLCKPQAE